MLKILFLKIKSNIYLYTFAKFLIFFSILFLLDFCIGSVLEVSYYKQKSGIEYRTAYSIDTTTAEMLVFGTSRANHQYYPDPFEKKLNISYYNVGRDGTSIFYKYAILKGILKRYSPNIVIFDFEEDELKKDQSSYDRISCLLPYYRNHKEIRSIVELKSPFERLKLISRIYPYNSSIFTIAAGNSEFYKKMSFDIKGYVPLEKVWNKPISIDSSSIISDLDSNKVKIFEAFINDCVNAKVNLYIICSPYFKIVKHSKYSIVVGQEIAEKHNIGFLNFTNDSTFINNRSLYADMVHFNDDGAKLFSEMVASRIIKLKEINQ